MYYGEIKTCDIANGPGVRTTLFVSGCRHHCEGCFQPETWNFEYGKPYTEETADAILKSLKPDYVRGLTLLGGEPFEPENQEVLAELLRDVKKYFPKKDIWCFSGYLFEELAGWQKPGETSLRKSMDIEKEMAVSEIEEKETHPRCDVTDEMLSLIDILVDGEFEQDKRELMLQFRGSSNQRIIRVAESLASGEVILWRDERSLESLMEKK